MATFVFVTLGFCLSTWTVFQGFSQYLDYARLGLGMPKLKSYQDYMRVVPSKGDNSNNLFELLLRALRRLYKTRVLYFRRLWFKTNYSTGFKIVLTIALVESSIDLLFSLLTFTVYYVICYNFICTVITPFVVIMLVGLFYHDNESVLPFVFWWCTVGYMLGNSIFFRSLPIFEKWHHYNLSCVTVSQLAGSPPGRDAWKYMAIMYGYILLRVVDDSVAFDLAFRKAEVLFETGAVVDQNFSEVLKELRTQILPFHVVLETSLADLCIQIKSLFVHYFSKWK